jgi:hypothetical protein
MILFGFIAVKEEVEFWLVLWVLIGIQIVKELKLRN